MLSKAGDPPEMQSNVIDLEILRSTLEEAVLTKERNSNSF